MTEHEPQGGTLPTTADLALDVRHDDFTVTRRLDATASAVFEAFADDAIRSRWFRLPGSDSRHRHEFSVGHGEHARSVFNSLDAPPERIEFRSHYLDIVAGRRIVFAYECVVDDVRRWASLVTVLIADDDSDGDCSVLTWTEQAVFLSRTGDGSADFPHLRGAVALRLNGLALALEPRS